MRVIRNSSLYCFPVASVQVLESSLKCIYFLHWPILTHRLLHAKLLSLGQVGNVKFLFQKMERGAFYLKLLFLFVKKQNVL